MGGGEKFHRFGKHINEMKKQLAILKRRLDQASVAEYNKIHGHLECLLGQEEIYWKQRSK